ILCFLHVGPGVCGPSLRAFHPRHRLQADVVQEWIVWGTHGLEGCQAYLRRLLSAHRATSLQQQTGHVAVNTGPEALAHRGGALACLSESIDIVLLRLRELLKLARGNASPKVAVRCHLAVAEGWVPYGGLSQHIRA